MKRKINVNNMNRNSSAGFTLIELLAVMVILGILAAAALPQFADLTEEAANASVASMAGSIESASNLNHAVNLAVRAGLSDDVVYGTQGESCADAAQAIMATEIDSDLFDITGGTLPAVDGTPHTCTITRDGAATSVDFIVIAATENP